MPNSSPSFKAMRYLKPDTHLEADEKGALHIHSNLTLVPFGRSIPHELKRQAKETPDRTCLSERVDGGDWQNVSYLQFDQQSDSIAQWLLDQNMGQKTPIVILSANSLNHAALILGAMKAQVPVCSISTPYSLMDKSFGKLKHCIELAKPSLIFAEDGELFAPALQQLEREGLRFISLKSSPEVETISFHDLLATAVSPRVSDSIDAIKASTVAKYFFTSGSTGMPKAVVHTQGMIMAYLAGIKSLYDPELYYTGEDYPVYLGWMPWSHVSAGSMTFHDNIMHGGTLYLDAGKPVPGMFEQTIINLKEVAPTLFGSAPIGFAYLVDALEQDAELRKIFYSRLETMVYGGAALPDDIVKRLDALAVVEIGTRIPITSGYGSTETHGISLVTWETDDLGLVGLPLPGVKLKLAPCAGKLEVRVKSDAVFSEYLGDPLKSASSFDEDGYFCVGDAAKLIDPNDVERGLAFNGRISEDFKLLSGTWVSAGNLRERLISEAKGLLSNVVICGENQHHVAAMAWLSEQANKLLQDRGLEALKAALTEDLQNYNQQNPSSSTKIKHLLLLKEAPRLNLSEITDKGYVNANAVIAQRNDEYLTLFDSNQTELVIIDQLS